MGMKVVIYDFNKSNKPITIFKNNSKGIKDFTNLLNEELRKHGIFIQFDVKN